MTKPLDPSTITAESSMTAEMLAASVLDIYEDPTERANAAAELGAVYGIDLETGIPIPDEEAAAAQKTVEQSIKDQEAALAAGDDGKPAAETTDDTGKTTEEPPAETAAEQSMREEMGQLRARNAELEARAANEDHQAKQADYEAKQAAVAARKAEYAESDAEFDRLIAETRENYGDDAAKPMEFTRKEFVQRRDAELAAYEAALKPPEPEPDPAAAEENPVEAIKAHKDLHSWFQGRDGDHKAIWAEAVKIDDALMKDPAWADKSFAIRYAEVEKRVKAGMANPPGPSDDKPKTEDEKIDAEIDKLENRRGAPSSLTDLGAGGEVQDALKAYEDIAPIDLLYSGRSVEQMDQLLDRFEGVAA